MPLSGEDIIEQAIHINSASPSPSPEIATITKFDVPWGAAPGQKVPVYVHVRNNDWKPQTCRVDFKVYTPERTFYTTSQTKSIWGRSTASYRFEFTMPDLPSGALVYLGVTSYQWRLWRGWLYAHGYTAHMRISPTVVVMPL